MPVPLMRVRCVGDGLLPLIDVETHATLMGRYCGRDKKGVPLPDGEMVPAISYYNVAIAQGDLALVSDKPAKSAGKQE